MLESTSILPIDRTKNACVCTAQTGGGGDAGYRKTGSLKDAVTHFQDYYVRPKKEYAHTDRRMSYGQQALDEWRRNNS